VADVQYLAFAARDFHVAHGRWPSHDELLAADASLARRDRWQHAFRYELTAHGLVVACDGIDGEAGTADDVRSDPVQSGAVTARN
jgi:hypothetical protein